MVSVALVSALTGRSSLPYASRLRPGRDDGLGLKLASLLWETGRWRRWVMRTLTGSEWNNLLRLCRIGGGNHRLKAVPLRESGSDIYIKDTPDSNGSRL